MNTQHSIVSAALAAWQISTDAVTLLQAELAEVARPGERPGSRAMLENCLEETEAMSEGLHKVLLRALSLGGALGAAEEIHFLHLVAGPADWHRCDD